jgi:hypothetical protein
LEINSLTKTSNKRLTKRIKMAEINNEDGTKPQIVGRYKPGQSGNPLGRPKGVPNATTSEVRRIITNIVADHLHQVYADLESLSPKDRVAAIIALSQIALPRLSAVAVGTADGGDGVVKKQVFLFGGKQIEF